MIRAPGPWWIALVVLAVTLLGGAVRAQDALSAAKDLYAAAAYDEALSALDPLRAGAQGPALIEIDQYRAFCLFALGRTQEAEAVAEGVVRADPLVELHAGDTSPRIVALFADLQKRMLPGLIRDRYRTARASMSEADPEVVQAELTLVQRMLAKAKSVGAWDEALADINVLVDGFLELNRTTGERRAAAKPVVPASTDPGPVASMPVASAAASPDVRPASTGAAPAIAPPAPGGSPSPVGGGGVVAEPSSAASSATPARPAIYSALDTQVTAPVVLEQAIPKVPANLAQSMRASRRSGVIEVTIDERGRVETALMRESVNPVFDGMVLTAARTWRYQPARLEGAPVRYLKRIAVALQ